MIAASSFDDIIAISVFSICFSIAVAEGADHEEGEHHSIWYELGFVAL